MKRRIFWVRLLYRFFRLRVYEAIAAIFWQSASYVCLFNTLALFVFKNFSLRLFISERGGVDFINCS